MSPDLLVRPTATGRPRPAAGEPGRTLTDHGFFMRWNKRRLWHGLTVTDRDELPSPRLTSGALNQGSVVVDTISVHRLNDGTLAAYRPDSHLKRLNNGAGRLALPPVDFDRVWGALRALIDLDRDWLPTGPRQVLLLRTVLAGDGATLDQLPGSDCLFYALATTGPADPADPAQRPALRGLVIDDYVRAFPGGVGNVNAVGNAAAAVVPGEIAANYGHDEVLWAGAGECRLVQQLGDRNLFFVIDGVLSTPSLDGTVLPGILRDSVIKLARDAGTRVDERPIELAEVLSGIDQGRISESFATSTVTGVVPVSALGRVGVDHQLAVPGPVTAHFQHLLDGIQSGELIDRFGWLRRSSEVAAVRV